MNRVDLTAFDKLFREACRKCFGHALTDPLTETASKLLYNNIFEQTGLTVGWKSLKNYSSFIMSDPPGKQENPSAATLDTLSRYVLDAPYSSETERKKEEGHYPWWYRYREQVVRAIEMDGPDKPAASNGIPAEGAPSGVVGRRRSVKAGWVFFILAAVILLLTVLFRGRGVRPFTDHFAATGDDSLRSRGWFVASRDPAWWERRGENPGSLTLFTLKGDNWPTPAQTPVIRDLLLRNIPCDCWTLEVHLCQFIPRANWQQAGILLSEDTGFAGKSIRISIAYNDYNGGYPKSRTILIQAITYLGNGFGKPEEIAHIPLFNVDSLDSNPILFHNLDHAALRIQRQGQKFRILYAYGAAENSSFKEIVSHEFAMEPRYAGLFALKGFVDSASDIAARFELFRLDCEHCGSP